MQLDLGIGLGAVALVVGFPILLLAFIGFLGRMEAWMLLPDERAAAVSRLLEQVDEAEELEKAVTLLMSDLAVGSRSRRRPQTVPRRKAMRIVGRRRTSHSAS